MTGGNLFAAGALLAWPIVAICLYATRPLPQATRWTLLGALLLLPAGVGIKFAMIPAIDKNSVSSVCALVGCLMLGRRPRAQGFGVPEILIFVFILSPFITSLNNNDTMAVGTTIIPGVGAYDAGSAVIAQLLLFLPFLVGRWFLRESVDAEQTLRALAIAGLIYSVPMLFEIRMSPQLAAWIYNDSVTMAVEYRYGGFRPVVFMQNGLAAAFFLATSVLASVALWRVGVSVWKLLPSGAMTSYLGVVLLLCKSAGALTYAVVGGAFARFATPRAQVRLAAILVSIAITYPVLRITDLFPTNTLLSVASVFSEERADSLRFRFYQEQLLLDHASERPFFGWGRYGRNRVYSEIAGGRDESITDGLWILTFGQFGVVGFIAQFGLFSLPVFRLLAAFKFIPSARERTTLAMLGFIVALSVVEQLPNSSINSWTWLLIGSLLGSIERLEAARRQLSPSREVRQAARPSVVASRK